MTRSFENDIPVAIAVPLEEAAVSPAIPSLPPFQVFHGPKKQHKNEQANTQTNDRYHSELLNENQIKSLMEQGFTRGLSKSLDQMMELISLRIWIIDNSGSMQKADGHRFIQSKFRNDLEKVECTRWEEIQECVNYHIRLAGLIRAPTQFRLLTGLGGMEHQQFFSVAEDHDPKKVPHDVENALNIMNNTRPVGSTPLTDQILGIYSEVSLMAPELRRMGKRVAVVIATDRLPTNERGFTDPESCQEFVHSLRLLQGLPVWVVLRLCTDEDNVLGFYNKLDNELDLSLDVLDDFLGEAIKVKKENPWLNYALSLHRLREMGYHERVFDMLDERALTKTEVRDFCALLLGHEYLDLMTDPTHDWKEFLKDIERLLRRESPQWNPVTKKIHSWMDLKKLKRAHRKRWF